MIASFGSDGAALPCVFGQWREDLVHQQEVRE
jgi:hypothetical protein